MKYINKVESAEMRREEKRRGEERFLIPCKLENSNKILAFYKCITDDDVAYLISLLILFLPFP